MAKKGKRPPATSKSKAKPKSGGKSQQLTKMDLVITGLFIGSVIFCIAAFSTAMHPMDEWFVIWPAVIGIVAGGLIGWLVFVITKFESLPFMIGIMAFSGALLAVAFVLSFNRPWDKSPPQVHTLDVVFKFQQGSGERTVHYLEVENFSQRQIEVEETIYNQVENGGQVNIITRDGFFGFIYLDHVEATGFTMPDSEDIPEVKPVVPLQEPPDGE